MNRFFFLFVSFLFVTILNLCAQENINSPGHSWKIGGGPVIELNYNLDKTFSSQIYNGLNYGWLIQLVNDNNKTRNVFGIQYAQGSLKANGRNIETQQTQYANFEYSFLLKVKPNTDHFIEWGAGSSVHVIYANRKYNVFINDNKTFEFAASIGTSVFLLHQFKGFIQGLSIYDQLDIPLVSYLIQPPFGYADPSNTDKNKSLYSRGITILGFSKQVRNCLIVDKEINNQQSISLSYAWTYYHFNNSRDVSNACHCINISYYHTL